MKITLSIESILGGIYAQSALLEALGRADRPKLLSRANEKALRRIIRGAAIELVSQLGDQVENHNLDTIKIEKEDLIVLEFATAGQRPKAGLYFENYLVEYILAIEYGYRIPELRVNIKDCGRIKPMDY